MTLSPFLFLFSVLLLQAESQSNGSPSTATYSILLTDPKTTYAAVSGTLYYDFPRKQFGFSYANGYKEIYKFNDNWGLKNSVNQLAFKLSPRGKCSPCASYSLSNSFPLTNNTAWTMSGVTGTLANTKGSVDSNGCRRYDVRITSSFITYFGLKESGGDLCYMGDSSGRLWTVKNKISGNSVDTNFFVTPDNCQCIQPIDIAISLDRSSSISVSSTKSYQSFIKQFVQGFYINSSDVSSSTQIGITQWGEVRRSWSEQNIGSIKFSMNKQNLLNAANNIGCTKTGGSCSFCYDRDPSEGSCFGFSVGTCTGCGVLQMKELYSDTGSYTKRSNAVKIGILITDGQSNSVVYPNNNYDSSRRCCQRNGDVATTCRSSGCNACPANNNLALTGWQKQSSSKYQGCLTDIAEQRDLLVNVVPDIKLFAIGVGAAQTDTLKAVTNGDDSTVFVESNFETLLNNIKTYTRAFCPLPPADSECGNCCGTCNCGDCVLPDTPVPPKPCSGIKIGIVGNCYSQVSQQDPCEVKSCKVSSCTDSADGKTAICSYTDLVCQQVNPCFQYACVNATGRCEGLVDLCTPTAAPTKAPTPAPTAAPTTAPTRAPTNFPTRAPTAAPTDSPTVAPTAAPTEEPTAAPTNFPTRAPTAAPTEEPTSAPTPPTPEPVIPTVAPTKAPSNAPTHFPTDAPTNTPTERPTRVPTVAPTSAPTSEPTEFPTYAPTNAPTEEPTAAPTVAPTSAPTNAPTFAPCEESTNGIGCGTAGNGHCCDDGVTCCCENGYTGVVCTFPPNFKECEANNTCAVAADACNDAYCDTEGPNATFKCIIVPKNCDDGDACTTDSCVVSAGGCVNFNEGELRCNDNNLCTVDTCNKATGECLNTPWDCSSLDDRCFYGYCDKTAVNESDRCIRAPIDCPRDNNCSIVECKMNYTDEKLDLKNYDGCVNTTLSCDPFFIGVVVAITGGAIAGIAVAGAFVVAGAMVAGSAAAISANTATETDAIVNQNPMYSAQSKGGAGLLSE